MLLILDVSVNYIRASRQVVRMQCCGGKNDVTGQVVVEAPQNTDEMPTVAD